MDDHEFYKDTLPNGLRVITVEMPHLHSIEMVCYVRAGGRNETPETAGISHFLEHMLFRGTAEYPSSLVLEQAFEDLGGAVNAATDSETTFFHSRFPPRNLSRGAALFASMLQRPLLGDLEVERRIILEEALEDFNERGEEISPDNLTAALLWPDHPLGIPTIGTRESLHRISLEDLRAYHSTFYSPRAIVFAVAGNIRRQEVLSAADIAFGDWEGENPPPCLAVPDYPGEKSKSVWVRDSGSQVNVQLAFRLPGRRGVDGAAMRVLRRVMGGTGTSRLMLRLREELGLTYNVEANLSLFEDSGCLAVDLSLAPENLVRAVQELLDILEDICLRPAGGQEIERTVRSFLFDLDFSRDHSDEMAFRFGWGETVDYLRTLEQDRRDIAAVTPEILQETARRFLVPNPMKTAVVGPYRSRDREAVEKLMSRFRTGI